MRLWGVLANHRLVLLLTLLSSTARAEEEAPKDKDYQAVVSIEPAELTAPGAGKLTLTIRPKAPWGLKVTTPFEATLTATAGLELSKTKLTAKDFVDPKAVDKTMVASFAVKTAGQQSINTALNFFLCTDQVCQRYKETVETKVPIK